MLFLIKKPLQLFGFFKDSGEVQKYFRFTVYIESIEKIAEYFHKEVTKHSELLLHKQAEPLTCCYYFNNIPGNEYLKIQKTVKQLNNKKGFKVFIDDIENITDYVIARKYIDKVKEDTQKEFDSGSLKNESVEVVAIKKQILDEIHSSDLYGGSKIDLSTRIRDLLSRC